MGWLGGTGEPRSILSPCAASSSAGCPSVAAARTKQYFHFTLHRRLDDILAAASPRKRVVLALDGPAPLAKLLEQR